MQLVHALLGNPVGACFVIIVLGAMLGRLSLRGISLGSSAVLFVALAFGHFAWVKPDTTRALGDFGVVLFVYAIGLQAGPSFMRTLRSKGMAPLAVGLATVLGGAACAAAIGLVLGLEPAMIVGLFAGALTSTPALAAATEAAPGSTAALVPVAYGVAYPIGVIGVVLFGQLVPRLMKGRDATSNRAVDAPASAPIHQRCYLVQNPACIGQRLSTLALHDLVSVNISRIYRDNEVLPSSRDLALQRGDIVLAVGIGRELDRLALIIGPPVPAEVELRNVPNVVARDVYVTEPGFAGRSLRELHVRSRYNIVITRVRREAVEFVPRGEFVLEVGDLVRAVGYEPDVQAFMKAAGIHEQRIHETGIPQFAFGLVLGLLLGFTPLPIPGGNVVRLGLAGGPLFVGLLLGHFGRIGRLRVHVPFAGRYLMRELGLVLFLVSAGTAAGAQLLPILAAHGWTLILLAAAVVVVSLLMAFGVAYGLFRQSIASTMGLACGAMTSTPGLGAATAQFDSDVPALAYAAVYPLALVAMTVVAQIMFAVL